MQEQEQDNFIFVKSPEVEKMGEVSKSEMEEKKQPDKNIYIANKEKMGQEEEQKEARDMGNIIFEIKNGAKNVFMIKVR